MNASLQTAIALTLVVLTVIGFIYRWWRGLKKPGCGGGCGCPSSKTKFKSVNEKRMKLIVTYVFFLTVNLTTEISRKIKKYSIKKSTKLDLLPVEIDVAITKRNRIENFI